MCEVVGLVSAPRNRAERFSGCAWGYPRAAANAPPKRVILRVIFFAVTDIGGACTRQAARCKAADEVGRGRCGVFADRAPLMIWSRDDHHGARSPRNSPRVSRRRVSVKIGVLRSAHAIHEMNSCHRAQPETGATSPVDKMQHPGSI